MDIAVVFGKVSVVRSGSSGSKGKGDGKDKDGKGKKKGDDTVYTCRAQFDDAKVNKSRVSNAA